MKLQMYHTNERSTLFTASLHNKLFEKFDSVLTNVLLFGKVSCIKNYCVLICIERLLNTNQNTVIFNATIIYFID